MTIGPNAIIATGTVVTKDVPGEVFAGGIPATVIRKAEDLKEQVDLREKDRRTREMLHKLKVIVVAVYLTEMARIVFETLVHETAGSLTWFGNLCMGFLASGTSPRKNCLLSKGTVNVVMRISISWSDLFGQCAEMEASCSPAKNLPPLWRTGPTYLFFSPTTKATES